MEVKESPIQMSPDSPSQAAKKQLLSTGAQVTKAKVSKGESGPPAPGKVLQTPAYTPRGRTKAGQASHEVRGPRLGF